MCNSGVSEFAVSFDCCVEPFAQSLRWPDQYAGRGHAHTLTAAIELGGDDRVALRRHTAGTPSVYSIGVEDQISGHTVLVTTKALDGGEPLKVYYAVAEPDPAKAIAIVRDGLGITSDEVIEAVGPLSAEQLIVLALAPGHFEQL